MTRYRHYVNVEVTAMAATFEIVDMEKRYLVDALAVYQWYVENSTATFQIRDSSVAEMESLLFFTDERYRALAAFEDGEFCGYGIITQYKSREAYGWTAEITVYLRPSSTGKGYGSLCIAHLENFARSRGLHVLIAQISGENGASERLFFRNGYVKCGHYHEVGKKFDRWIDLVCYEKKL